MLACQKELAKLIDRIVWPSQHNDTPVWWHDLMSATLEYKCLIEVVLGKICYVVRHPIYMHVQIIVRVLVQLHCNLHPAWLRVTNMLGHTPYIMYCSTVPWYFHSTTGVVLQRIYMHTLWWTSALQFPGVLLCRVKYWYERPRTQNICFTNEIGEIKI